MRFENGVEGSRAVFWWGLGGRFGDTNFMVGLSFGYTPINLPPSFLTSFYISNIGAVLFQSFTCDPVLSLRWMSVMRGSDAVPIRLLTHNIRYATRSPFRGEEKWEIRRPRLINELRFNTAYCAESFICLQEVLHDQLKDILHGLNETAKTWDFVGVGRDDGYEAGEYSPIIYQPGIWELKAQRTKWLSETPDRPSKGWDAASIRILTIAVFQHRSSRKTVVAMNTHLDDQGSHSRLEAARIILAQVRLFATSFSQPGSSAVFLAGDFNSEPDQEAYREMTNVESPMFDLQDTVKESKRYGNFNTFTGFDPETRRKRIDFLFLNSSEPDLGAASRAQGEKSEGCWRVEGYAVLPNLYEDGVYNSDHQAVVGDVVLT